MTPTISRNQTDGVDAESPQLDIHGPIENCSEGNHEETFSDSSGSHVFPLSRRALLTTPRGPNHHGRAW